MTNIIIDHFPKEYEVYVEGFGGGASVLFQKEKTPLEVYNDLGENVYSLFKVISDKDMFERLKEKMGHKQLNLQLHKFLKVVHINHLNK